MGHPYGVTRAPPLYYSGSSSGSASESWAQPEKCRNADPQIRLSGILMLGLVQTGASGLQMPFNTELFLEVPVRNIFRETVHESWIEYDFNSLISLPFSNNDSHRVHKSTF